MRGGPGGSSSLDMSPCNISTVMKRNNAAAATKTGVCKIAAMSRIICQGAMVIDGRVTILGL